ncbi:MAG: ABC-F family ATP-binding cassette domain-containing protein [Bradymonadia bacterium]
MIHLQGLAKQYGHKVLFTDLDWHIKRGQRVGLVGPNGAGKSTLIRILTGEVSADHGEISKGRQITVGHLAQEIATVKGITVRAEARKGLARILDMQQALTDLEARMAEGDQSQGTLTAYSDLQGRFEMVGGYQAESRVEEILAGLGFKVADFERDCGELSGGWQMRVALARLLLQQPDILLLDEPTNHLDLESVEWLEGFLRSYSGSLVLISHDRAFLNSICSHIAALSDGSLTVYTGDFDAFVAQAELRATQAEQAKRNLARKSAELNRFIERFRAKATKARQVQSRVKMLEKLEQVDTVREAQTIRIKFPQPPRSGRVVLRLDRVHKAYGDKIIYQGLGTELIRGQKVALVGANGSGKSTLLKLFAGVTPYQKGIREVGHKVRVYYFAQHQVEALDLKKTVYQEANTEAGDMPPSKVRAALGAFLFTGEDADKPVAVLSGGEKNRLALAKMLLNPANVLLLDEPTNHLDMASRQVLEEAIADFEGTVVLISHDRHFIDGVANQVWEVNEGRIYPYIGSYSDYIRRKAREDVPEPLPLVGEAALISKPTAPVAPAEDEEEGAGRRKKSREQKREEAEARQRRAKETKALRATISTSEKTAERLEAELEELRAVQASPEHYQDPKAVREVAESIQKLEGALETTYAEWEEASAALEAYDAEHGL